MYNYTYNYMYQYPYNCMYPCVLNVIIFFSSDKSPLRLVVNKKSSKTLSAF